MRQIIVCNFITMDGVMQSPGGPEEDTRHDFKWGGWSVPHWDDLMNEQMAKITAAPYDLLLGRRTYDIFADFWPKQKGDPTAETFNRIEKFVVSSRPQQFNWQRSTLISGDVVASLKALKGTHGPALLVYGSGRLVQTLLEHQLVDVLHAWVFPVTLGKGQKLFEEGTGPLQWKVTDARVSTTGVAMLSYQPAGAFQLGSMSG